MCACVDIHVCVSYLYVCVLMYVCVYVSPNHDLTRTGCPSQGRGGDECGMQRQHQHDAEGVRVCVCECVYEYVCECVCACVCGRKVVVMTKVRVALIPRRSRGSA